MYFIYKLPYFFDYYLHETKTVSIMTILVKFNSIVNDLPIEYIYNLKNSKIFYFLFINKPPKIHIFFNIIIVVLLTIYHLSQNLDKV